MSFLSKLRGVALAIAKSVLSFLTSNVQSYVEEYGPELLQELHLTSKIAVRLAMTAPKEERWDKAADYLKAWAEDAGKRYGKSIGEHVLEDFQTSALRALKVEQKKKTEEIDAKVT